MAGEGFEYFPPNGDGATVPLVADLSRDEYLERYGLGVSTLRYEESSLSTGLVGRADTASQTASDIAIAERNEQYLDSLSSDARDAYYEALEGDHKHVSLGCLGEVSEIEQPDRILWLFIESLGSEIAALETAIANDPRILERREEVRRCVASHGYDFGGTDVILSAQQHIDAMLLGLSIDEETFDAQLKDIQAFEIDITRTILDCDPSIFALATGDDEVLAAVRLEYEERFGEEYRDQIEAVLLEASSN